MHSDLLLPHLHREMMENYFEICRYFILTKSYGRQEDRIRLNYYRSLLLADPCPAFPVKNRLDLEIIASARDVKSALARTYTSEFIIEIVDSGIDAFFDKMERCAAIDVHLRSLPELYQFFLSLTPSLVRKLKEAVRKEFCCLPAGSGQRKPICEESGVSAG